jgi:hypothetical protein
MSHFKKYLEIIQEMKVAKGLKQEIKTKVPYNFNILNGKYSKLPIELKSAIEKGKDNAPDDDQAVNCYFARSKTGGNKIAIVKTHNIHTTTSSLDWDSWDDFNIYCYAKINGKEFVEYGESIEEILRDIKDENFKYFIKTFYEKILKKGDNYLELDNISTTSSTNNF